MSKKIRVLVSVLVAVVMLMVGGVATVMAQEEPAPDEPVAVTEEGREGLLARVAEILGIPEEDLANAFQQARQEMRLEAFFRHLDKAVEEGTITEEEANEIKEWLENKPEALDRLFPGGHLFPGMRNRRMMGISDEAMMQGAMNRIAAPRIGAWREKKPESLDRALLRSRIFQALPGRPTLDGQRGLGN